MQSVLIMEQCDPAQFSHSPLQQGRAGHSKYTKYPPSLDAECGTRLCVETLIYFISSQY